MIKYSHRFSLGLIILAGGESSRMGHDKATCLGTERIC